MMTAQIVGLTMLSNQDERQLVPVETIRARIVATYGGRAMEEIQFLTLLREILDRIAETLMERETPLGDELELIL